MNLRGLIENSLATTVLYYKSIFIASHNLTFSAPCPLMVAGVDKFPEFLAPKYFILLYTFLIIRQSRLSTYLFALYAQVYRVNTIIIFMIDR